MAPLHSILASDDQTLIKVIGAVVVLIIWGISSLASGMAKVRQNAAKRQQQNRIGMSAAPQRAPSRPAMASRAPAALPPLPTRTAPPLPPLRTLASPSRQSRPAVAKTAARPKAAAAAPVALPMQTPSANRQVVPTAVTSLLRPKTVRAQFILAEVLQPPLALRNRKMF